MNRDTYDYKLTVKMFSLCMKEQVHGDYKVRVDQQDRVLCHSKHHEVRIICSIFSNVTCYI